MSSDDRSERTSITVSRSIFNRLQTFCDTYDIKGKGKGIDSLLSIASAAGVPMSLSDQTEQMAALDVDSVSDIHGFLIETNKGTTEFVGINGDRAVLIDNVSSPQAAVQPMVRTKITKGTAVCPVCGDHLLEYELSDSFPGVETGVFNDLTLNCNTCDSERPHYTLFAAKPGASPSVPALKDAMISYMAYILIVESMSPDEFAERLKSCTKLASDGNWEWLPDPSNWVGFSIEQAGIGPVDQQMYAEFFKSYSRLVMEDVGNLRVMDIYVSSPDETEDYFEPMWQIQIESNGGDVSIGIDAIKGATEAWESVDVSLEELDLNTFADDTVLVSLSGLTELKES